MGISALFGVAPEIARQEYVKRQAEIDLMKQQAAELQDEEAQRGKVIGMKKGGKVSSASKRADGIAQRGKTRGKMVY